MSWCYRSRVRLAVIAVAVGMLAACSTSTPRAVDGSNEVGATALPGIEMAAVPAGSRSDRSAIPYCWRATDVDSWSRTVALDLL